jgi:hypothetical protein
LRYASKIQRTTAGPGSTLTSRGEETPGCIPAQIPKELSLAQLVDRVDQLPSEILPVDFPLSDCLQPNACSTEGIDPVSGVEGIEPSETILIPTKYDPELAGGGVLPHLQKPSPPLGGVAGDRLVEVLADDPVVEPGCVLGQFNPLSGD